MNDMKKEIGLYIHIPFCVRKCLYCDFLSGAADENTKKDYVNALIAEISQWKNIIKEKYKVKTIFIGGGTPTCLPPNLLMLIGDALSDMTDYVTEYTIESYPGTITKKHIEAFKHMGINRVSIGLQSANDDELKNLGRIHTYKEFLECFEMLSSEGFDNIKIDIMSDIPGQTIKSYENTLKKVIGLRSEHISAYSLIVEPGTPFYDMEQSGKLDIADEETDRQMYHLTKDILLRYGYKRYEISNYSLTGFECKHNLTYWKANEYLGLGLGAASYLDGMRFSNERDIKRYLEMHNKKEMHNEKVSSIKNIFSVKEIAEKKEDINILTKENMMEEFMFLGLRKCEGVSCNEFEVRFGISLRSIYGDVIDRFLKNKLLAEDNNSGRIYLTERGMDISNYVMSEFML